jgi:hypothetical protein
MLEFIAPFTEIMDGAGTQAQWETALEIGFTVWNAVVFHDAVGDAQYLERMLGDSKGNPIHRIVVEQLVARKRDLFAADHRLIGNYRVRIQDGEVYLWAEARDPYTIGGKDGKRTRRST